ncbi:hypothetical protein L3Q67_45255 (plasmid) [Saccharothrix sp. AJ9571]|nr:hypothetical protein L3Q67_45255 [Saccharothrix sp. AJ9571]
MHDHVVTKSRVLEPRVPTGHQWLRQLDALCEQLEDPTSTLRVVGYLHTGIRERLERALASTDAFLNHNQERMTAAKAAYDEHLRTIYQADDDAPYSGPEPPARPTTPAADGLSRQQRRALERARRKHR